MINPGTERRLKIIQVGGDVIFEALRGVDVNALLHKLSLPDDVKLVWFYTEPRDGIIYFVVESESFAPIPCGLIIEKLPAILLHERD